ncbi:hypothetical protein MMC34_008663 [Xylographa carneopallida]|nr:hypothetical protein [Xylographa carneopallida]
MHHARRSAQPHNDTPRDRSISLGLARLTATLLFLSTVRLSRSSSATSLLSSPSAYSVSDDEDDGASTVSWRMESTYDRLTRIHPNIAVQQQQHPQPAAANANSASTSSPATKRRRSASNPFTLPIAVHWERGREKRERRQRSAEKRKAVLIAAGAVKQEQLAVKEEDKENAAPHEAVTAPAGPPAPPLTPTTAATTAAAPNGPVTPAAALPPSSLLSLPSAPMPQPSTVQLASNIKLHAPSTAFQHLSTSTLSTPVPSLCSLSSPLAPFVGMAGKSAVPAPLPVACAHQSSPLFGAALPGGGPSHPSRPRLPVRSLARPESVAIVQAPAAAYTPVPAAGPATLPARPPARTSLPFVQTQAQQQPTRQAVGAAVAPSQPFVPVRHCPAPPPPSPVVAQPWRPQPVSHPQPSAFQLQPSRSLAPSTSVTATAAVPNVPVAARHPLPPPVAPLTSSQYQYHYSSRPAHTPIQPHAQPQRPSVQPSLHAPPQPPRQTAATYQSPPQPAPQAVARLPPYQSAPPSPIPTVKQQFPLPTPPPNIYRTAVKQEYPPAYRPPAPAALPSPSLNPHRPAAAPSAVSAAAPVASARPTFFTDDDDEDELMALSQAYDTAATTHRPGG